MTIPCPKESHFSQRLTIRSLKQGHCPHRRDNAPKPRKIEPPIHYNLCYFGKMAPQFRHLYQALISVNSAAKAVLTCSKAGRGILGVFR